MFPGPSPGPIPQDASLTHLHTVIWIPSDLYVFTWSGSKKYQELNTTKKKKKKKIKILKNHHYKKILKQKTNKKIKNNPRFQIAEIFRLY